MKQILKRESRNSKPEIRNLKMFRPAKTGATPGRNGKTSPVQELESAIAARRKSQSELTDHRKLLADKSARQLALEKTGDLDNLAVITEIASLQVFTCLLPRRIAVKEEADAQAEQTLTEAVNQFIHQHLGPRVRRLAARTRANVERELASHLRDPAALILGVSQSDRVRRIESLALPATLHPPRGAIAHAETALKAWSSADEIEKTMAQDSVEP
jgi:hypothetical protein